MNKLKPYFIPILIFVIALSLRFYHLPERFIFGTDEEYQAHYAMTLVRDFHPIWIGVSAADTGFYLGPYWTFFTAFWLKISGGDPLITGYVSSVLGSITSVLLYFLISKIASNKAALFSALLYATSPLVIFFDQKYWNPSSAPLLVTLILLCLSLAQTSTWYFIFSLILYSFVWHVHLSLVPLILVIAAYYFKFRPRLTFVQLIVATFGILAVMLPLLIFDFNHNFSNLKAPLRMIENSSSSAPLRIENLQVYASTVSRLFWINPGSSNVSEARNPCSPNSLHSSPQILVVLLISAIVAFVLWRFRSQPFSWALLILSLSFLLYPGEVSSYYYLGAFPLILSAFAIFISTLFPHIQKICTLILVSLNLLLIFLTSENYGYKNKINLITSLKSQVGSSAYSLSWDNVCFTQEGWRYLFQQKMPLVPSSSPSDGIFGWLYDTNEVKIKPSVSIDLTPDDYGYAYKITPNP